MSSQLWMSIEPSTRETRLALHEPGRGQVMRARFPTVPNQPRALASLLESVVAWYGRSLSAVLDADAEDVRRHPDRWARLLGDLDSAQIAVQWSQQPDARNHRDRFLGRLGDFRSASRLVGRAAGGLR